MRLDWTFWLPLLAGLALAIGLRARPSSAEVDEVHRAPATHGETQLPAAHYRLFLGLLIVLGLGVRLWLFGHLAAEPTGETLALVRACDLPQSMEADNIGAQAHAPLHSLLLRVFILLFEPLSGGGLGLLELRLPNLVLAALSILLTARLGRTVGSPVAGLAAATLVAFAPFVLIMSVPQESYLLEAVTALWFCDRVVAYVVLRRPAHQTLVLSAALAMWSGYLNALVVGPLGCVALAVMWRRHERGRAAVTALATLLLVLPVLLPALRALSVYVTLAGSEGLSPEEAAERARQLNHPLMDNASTFSRGRFWPALIRISEALFGQMWWLVFVGAGGLMLARRWLSLALAAPLSLFAATGCFIVLNPQNYALTLPYFALTAACGLDALAGLVVPLRFRTVARVSLQLAALAPALWLAHLALPVSGPGSRYELRFVFDAHPAELIRLVRENPSAPVLTYEASDYGFVNQYLCAEVTQACKRASCMMQGGDRKALGSALALVERGRTRTMLVNRDGPIAGRELFEAVRAVVGTPEIVASGFIVLRPAKLVDRPPALTVLDGHLRERCPEIASYQSVGVLWCRPGTRL